MLSFAKSSCSAPDNAPTNWLVNSSPGAGCRRTINQHTSQSGNQSHWLLLDLSLHAQCLVARSGGSFRFFDKHQTCTAQNLLYLRLYYVSTCVLSLLSSYWQRLRLRKKMSLTTLWIDRRWAVLLAVVAEVPVAQISAWFAAAVTSLSASYFLQTCFCVHVIILVCVLSHVIDHSDYLTLNILCAYEYFFWYRSKTEVNHPAVRCCFQRRFPNHARFR